MPKRPILLGVVGRAHGVRGLVRVTSHTADPAALTGYGPLSDPSGRRFTLRWMSEGIAEISEIVDGGKVKIVDRAAAERLTNTRLFIERDRLPTPEPDEYYLADLIGLSANGTDRVPFGIVSAVHDYGAGVSLEISRDEVGSLLIPFTAACVPEVDVAAGRVTVVPPDEIDVPIERRDLSGEQEVASFPPQRTVPDCDPPMRGRHPLARPEDAPRGSACIDPGDQHRVDIGDGPADDGEVEAAG